MFVAHQPWMFRNSVRQTVEADLNMGEVGILRGAGAASSDAPAFSPTFSSSSIRPLPSTPRVAEGSTENTPGPAVNGRGVVVIGTTPPGTRRLYNCFEPEVAQGGASPGEGGAAGMRGWLHKGRDHLPGTLLLSLLLSSLELSDTKTYGP